MSPSPALAAFLEQYGFSSDELSALQPDRRFTPLMRACKEGRLDLVRELLSLGVDLQMRNADGCNALWLACYHGDPALLDCLLDAGIDIDLQNGNGATCLMYVASNSKPALVRQLLVRGANPLLKNFDDFTALDLAASRECLNLLRPYKPGAGLPG